MKISPKTIETLLWLFSELLTVFRQIKKEQRNGKDNNKEE